MLWLKVASIAFLIFGTICFIAAALIIISVAYGLIEKRIGDSKSETKNRGG